MSPPNVFEAALAERSLPGLARGRLTTLQVNLTLRCNLACHHCHVESSPKRTEEMGRKTCERLLELLAASPAVDTLDLTGGAPELHPDFRMLVRGGRALGRHGNDPSNQTVLFEPDPEDTAEFLLFYKRERFRTSIPKHSIHPG